MREQRVKFLGLILLYIITISSFISCNRNDDSSSKEETNFMLKETPGLFMNGRYCFEYNNKTCQFVINKRRKQYRLQTDNQSYYMNVIMNKFPTMMNEEITVELSYKLGSVENVKNVILNVVKVNSDIFWLWSDEEKLGIVYSLNP
jgi:hypothetical protein